MLTLLPPVTPTELRTLPPDAQRLARLAALDTFLRHMCPRRPTEAEVRELALRLRYERPGEDDPDIEDTPIALAA